MQSQVFILSGKPVLHFRPCTALFALALAALLLFPSGSFAREVRVATYNIENGTGDIGSDEYNALHDILARMDADIVCFQELRTATFGAWSNLASTLGYPYAAISEHGPFAGYLYNGFFSRYPILSTYNVQSPTGAVELSRFPFRAVIDVPDALRPLVLWTMHHKSSAGNIDKFRRSIEALRIVQNVDAYLAENPTHTEYVLTGDMNDDIRDAQTPAQFAAQPNNAPNGFILGSDVTFPVAYATFPSDRYADAGAGFRHMPAYWEGTSNPVTRIASSRQLDYIYLSPPLMDSPLGAPQAEVYNSAADAGGGLPKAGSPLPARASAASSDHLPLFVDLHMADFSCVIPTAPFLASGDPGGPFVPGFHTYAVTETNEMESTWVVAPDVDWLSLDTYGFTLPPLSPIEVDVYFNELAAALPPGTHEGSVTFGNETTGQLETRHVVLTVRDHLATTPAEGFSARGEIGGPFTPYSQTYVVTNKSPQPIAFTATATNHWLTVSPSSWLLQAHESVAVQVALNANASSLPIGAYADTVVISNQVTGLLEERPVTLAVAGTICDAVDACDLPWSTGGDAPWSFQAKVASDGSDAAQSGFLAPNQSSWLETVVEGPLQIHFDWKVSSRSTHFVRFLVDGAQCASLSGETDWTNAVHDIATGVHTLRWAYAISATAPQGVNAAWLDQVRLDYLSISPSASWTSVGLPGGPFVPASRSYVLTNSGAMDIPWSIACAADWLNVSPLSGVLPPGGFATVDIALNANANTLPLGSYPSQLVFSNRHSGLAQFRPVVLSATGSLCEALDDCQLAWTTGGDAPWFNQTNRTFDGTDAAQAGALSPNQESWIETTVQGPARVTFQWCVSARTPSALRFLLDGNQRSSISGTSTTWAKRLVEISSGVHTLRWAYVTSSNSPLNENSGWLDQVTVDALRVSPTNGWHASGSPGGPFSPQLRTFTVTNGGHAAAAWTAAASVNWLSLSSSSGVLFPGEATSVTAALVSATAALLPLGSHPAAIVFSNLASGLTTTIPAFLDTRGSLCESTDACFLDWSSGGALPWFPQTTTSFDGVDAAQSGALSTNQQTWMEALVEGPVQLQFQWRVSSRTNAHYLSFLIDGSTRAMISGNTEWAARSFELPPGVHTARWSYANSSTAPSNANTAWVDQVHLERFAVSPVDGWTASGLPGGPFSPSSQTYILTNSGPESLAWSASTNLAWLSVEPSAGTLAPGEGAAVEMFLNPNAATLSTGTRTATATFSNLVTDTRLQRSVTLAIRDHLVATPASSYHSGFVGLPSSPGFQLFSLSNAGPDEIEWAIVRATNWLSAEPLSGALAPGATNQVLVTLNEESRFLPVGRTSTYLVFSNLTTRQTQFHWIYLDQQSPLVLSSPGWVPSGPVGGPFSPPSATFTLFNQSPAPQQWALSTDAPWLSLDSTTGTLSSNTSQSLPASLNAMAEELTMGYHSASLFLVNLDNGTTLTQTVHLVAGISFCDSLDACGLAWSLGGDAPWLYQTNVTRDGIDAAESGAITHSQESWMQTTAAGPGTLDFCWSVSSEANYDYLEFWIDGVRTNRISGLVDWLPQSFTIGVGTHTFRWRYMKDDSADAGSDCGRVDQVSWTPTRTAMGVPVSWYLRYGLAPGQAETYDALDWRPAASGDPNWFQYLSGLDPTNPAALFQILDIHQVAGEPVRIDWLGGTNGPAAPYVIQTTLDLDHGPWESLGSSPRTAGTNTWTGEEAGPIMRFYRIQAAPDSNP